MSLDCPCKDWSENIEKINGPIRLQTIRSGFKWQFDGAKFVFCPWCGSKLTTEWPPADPGSDDKNRA